MSVSTTLIAASAVVVFNAGNPSPNTNAALPVNTTTETTEVVLETEIQPTVPTVIAETLTVDGAVEIEISNDIATNEVTITNSVAPVTEAAEPAAAAEPSE